jgi:hypothetical protein
VVWICTIFRMPISRRTLQSVIERRATDANDRRGISRRGALIDYLPRMGESV